MVNQLLKTESPERFVYELLCEKSSATESEIYEILSKKLDGVSRPRVKLAIMRLEMAGIANTYERKENELVVALAEKD